MPVVSKNTSLQQPSLAPCPPPSDPQYPYYQSPYYSDTYISSSSPVPYGYSPEYTGCHEFMFLFLFVFVFLFVSVFVFLSVYRDVFRWWRMWSTVWRECARTIFRFVIACGWVVWVCGGIGSRVGCGRECGWCGVRQLGLVLIGIICSIFCQSVIGSASIYST